MDKKSYSCLERSERGSVNPVRYLTMWCRNIKYMYQRIRYGYCDRDVWSIDNWFLNVVPNMLEDLKENTHGYPNSSDVLSHALVETGASKEVDEEGMKKWKEILSEIIVYFREANEDTCTKINPYEAEYEKVSKEFMERFGVLGEKLMTEEEKAEGKEKGYCRMYMVSDIPEYKEISDLYFEEERKLDKYRHDCKDKGMNLFKKWFYDLWD